MNLIYLILLLLPRILTLFKEIIKFSHQFHIEEEVACADCHTEVESSVDLSASLLPTMDACANCHDVDDEEECSTCHYENVQEPFPVKSPELYFSHKSHMENENAECTSCHGGLSEVDFSFESSKATS